MTEHVKPSRDDIARATFDAFHSAYVPRVHWDEAPRFVLDNHRDLAVAVLALLPGRTEAEVMAEWADYFEQHDQNVGAEPLTPMRMVRILRGPKPFGVAGHPHV